MAAFQPAIDLALTKRASGNVTLKSPSRIGRQRSADRVHDDFYDRHHGEQDLSSLYSSAHRCCDPGSPSAAWRSKNRGPFLTIINFDDGDDNEGPMRAVQAYAQPVHSGDTLYPVESGFERSVLDFLIWAQGALAKAAPFMKIAIHKPLFAISTEDGPCQPDFILDISIRDRPAPRLIIEAMGFDTDEYEAAKAATVPRMRRIGPVFEIRPPQISEQNAAATSKLLLDWILANTHLT